MGSKDEHQKISQSIALFSSGAHFSFLCRGVDINFLFKSFNPTEATTIPKNEKTEKTILLESQIETFMQALEGDEIWHDFFCTAIMTGMRRGERSADLNGRTSTRSMERSTFKGRCDTFAEFISSAKPKRTKETERSFCLRAWLN